MTEMCYRCKGCGCYECNSQSKPPTYPPYPKKEHDELLEILIKETSQGTKHDTGKPPMSLISQELMVALAEVRAFGAIKYERWNWAKGFKYTRSIDAALRHIHAFNSGEDCDPESGLTHIIHAIACLEHLLHDYKYRPENDDRYKRRK